MPLSTLTLIWLFPLVFMLHDFEEIILGEAWLRKNAAEIKARLENRIPAFLFKQMSPVLDKSTAELAITVSLIFSLTCIAAFLAAEYRQYAFFLATSGLFFVHGFGHLGQAIALRKYVPAVITSVVFVIPYGLVLFGRLIQEHIVELSGLLVYFVLGAVLAIPFLVMMHKAGAYLYKLAVKLLID